ncbi:hypothetical protein L3Q82_019228, partial [Scortum barcoo]
TNVFIHVLFSLKLSPAERNYNVGNQELLAIKVALEEWRHCLEGAEHPFIVWIDRKNLEFVRTAKRLNLQGGLSFSVCSDIVSDRGPQFVSSFWKEFCQLLIATVSLSSGYHPESNGQTEWLNQELETCLRCLVAQNQTSWTDHLTWIEYAHNSLPTATTGLSPFQVTHDDQPPLFPVNKEEVTVPSAHAMAKRCRKIWAAARQIFLRGQERMKTTADRHRHPAPAYTLGQKVAIHEGPASPCALQETRAQ